MAISIGPSFEVVHPEVCFDHGDEINGEEGAYSGIATKLRQVDVLMAQGWLVADAVRAIGETEVRTAEGATVAGEATRGCGSSRAVSDLTLDHHSGADVG